MTKVILFDIDGTLIRTGGAGVLAFENAFRTAFHIPGATLGVEFAGRTDTSIAREIFRRHALEPSKQNFARCFEAYVFWLDYLLGQHQGSVLPGVQAAVEQAARWPQPPILGLLTGNIRLGAEIKLRHYSLWEHFAFGAFGDDDEDRNCLARLAADRAGRLLGAPFEPEEVLVIGDTAHDIACGASIGARTLAVATGPYSKAQLALANPTRAVDCLAEVDLFGIPRPKQETNHKNPSAA